MRSSSSSSSPPRSSGPVDVDHPSHLAAIAFAFRHNGRPADSAVVQRATRNAARRVPEHRRQAAPLRLSAGVTQTELAQRAGMAQSAISDYERGRKKPSLSTLQRLAAAVDLVADVQYSPAPVTESLASLRTRRGAILEICGRHGASNPRIFGSMSTGTARPDSDVDLLVDLEPGRTYFDVAGLHDDLVELLGRQVDILSAGSLRGRIAHVARDAVPL